MALVLPGLKLGDRDNDESEAWIIVRKVPSRWARRNPAETLVTASLNLNSTQHGQQSHR